MGFEAAGVVVEVGSQVQHVQVGDSVSIRIGHGPIRTVRANLGLAEVRYRNGLAFAACYRRLGIGTEG